MNISYTIGGNTFHLLFPDLLRPLSSEEYADLEDSILDQGMQMPVIVDERNGVIDGGHRLEVAWANDLDTVPVSVLTGLDEDQKRKLALSLNIARRQLTPAELQEQRQERIERAAQARRNGQSLRTIAEQEGVSESQIRSDLDKATAQGCAVDPENGKITGRDGKQRPATRQTPANGHAEIDSPTSPLTPGPAPSTVPPETVEDPTSPGSSEPDEDDEGPELAIEAPEIPTDEEGVPLPSQAVLAFDGLPTLRKHLKALDTLKKSLEEARKEPWACWVHWESILGYLKSARSSLYQGRPACVCPYCRGSKPDCTACRGRGFVTRVAYDNAPPEMKSGQEDKS